MSNLSGSVGEGRGAGAGGGGRSVDVSGYGDGAGNVDTGTQFQEGTGFDPATGKVKTSFGHYDIGYDPVTGAATRGTTLGYNFPGEGLDAIAGGMQAGTDLGAVGGLGDVFAPAPGHTTTAAWEQTGQGIREATDAGAYLGQPSDRTAREAEGWRDRRQPNPEREGLERPSAHRRKEGEEGKGEEEQGGEKEE